MLAEASRQASGSSNQRSRSNSSNMVAAGAAPLDDGRAAKMASAWRRYRASTSSGAGRPSPAGRGRPAVEEPAQADRWRGGVAVAPQTGPRVEAVRRQKPDRGGGDHVHGFDDEVELRLGEVEAEAQPGPPRLDAEPAVDGLAGEPMGVVQVDAQQPVAVRSGAGAAAAALDADRSLSAATTKLW